MGNVKDLDSTAIYAWTTLISVLICVPAAIIFEGGALKDGLTKAAEAHPDFYYKLAAVGLLYHLYNQARLLSSVQLNKHLFPSFLELTFFSMTMKLRKVSRAVAVEPLLITA